MLHFFLLIFISVLQMYAVTGELIQIVLLILEQETEKLPNLIPSFMFDPCPTASSAVLHIQWLLLNWFWLRAVFIKLSFIVLTIPTLWFKNASAISYIDSLMNSIVLPLLFPLPVLSSISAAAHLFLSPSPVAQRLSLSSLLLVSFGYQVCLFPSQPVRFVLVYICYLAFLRSIYIQ